jgi:hypothetical protein
MAESVENRYDSGRLKEVSLFRTATFSCALVVAGFCLWVNAPLLMGQAGSRFVEGTVSDEKGHALEGAVVQLKNTVTLRIRSFITDRHGRYHFSGLSRDIDYELVAKHSGVRSSTRTLSQFDSRWEATVDLEVKLAR